MNDRAPGTSTAPPGLALGVTTVLMTLAGWSSVPLFLKHFSREIDVWTSNGWRYGFSALLWLPVIVLGAARGRLPAGLWKRALVPGLFNTLGQVCFAWTFYKIDPGLATFALRLQIIFLAIGAYLLFESERRVVRSSMYLTGGGLVLAGTTGTLVLGGGLPAGGGAVGVALAVGAGLFFSCYGLSVRKFMQGINSVTAFAAISQYTALAMILFMLFFSPDHGASAWSLGWGPFGLLLVSSVVGIALGHVFYYMSIARLGIAVSAGVIQLQPIVVTAGSAVLFNERMTALQLGAGAVAILGAGLMLLVQHRLTRADRRRAAGAIPAEEGEGRGVGPD